MITAIAIAALSAGLLVAMGVNNFQSTRENAADLPQVIASVETGSVERSVAVQIHSSPASSLRVPSTQFGPGIVTSAPPGEGTVLNEGDILAAINELPVMILQGELPAYRSIGDGARGNDVRQLQDYLRRSGYSINDEAGVFKRSTALALSELYKSRGEPLVNSGGVPVADWPEVGLPLSRYVFVAATPVVLGAECGRVGQPSDALQCVISSQASTLTISEPSGQSLTGLPVSLRTTDGREIAGTVGDPVTAVEEGPSAESDDPVEADQRWFSLLDVPEEAKGVLADSAQVIVEATAPEGMRVPATAIRETADGQTFVREESQDRQSPSQELDHTVTVSLCSGGYCAVSGESLVAGLRVVLLG